MDLSKKKSLYYIFSIKKKNGKKRLIHAPCHELKLEQKRLCKKLEKTEEISKYCFGFVKGKNSAQAAVAHVGKDWVLCLDIMDFFPSIKKEHLTFLSDYEYEIATLENKLIQGSPSSPCITNIVMKDFDEQVGLHFNSRGISYTRYADDITLSGYGFAEVREMIEFIKVELKRLDLRVNHEKTEFKVKNKNQSVLGINVNTMVSINKKTRKNLRAAIHQGNVNEEILGYLSYINSVNEAQYNKLLNGV